MMSSALKAPDHVLVHLRRARDHADRHFAEPLDLHQLACVATLSKFHFQRLFTATYGQTPAALWQLAAELGEQIRHLRPQRSSLEEVFLQAVGEKA